MPKMKTKSSAKKRFKLTSKGKTAYFAHKHWHETMDGGFKEFFLNLKPERIDFLIDFLAKLETFLKKALM